jgi:hypothetical protein
MSKEEKIKEACKKANGYLVFAPNTKGVVFEEGFIQCAKWQQEQSNCELSELLEENQQLKKWKQEAMTVFSQIDLQEIGKLLNIKLGTSVSEQLLPKFIELLEQRNEMLAMLERVDGYATSFDKWDELEQLIKKVKDNG